MKEPEKPRRVISANSPEGLRDKDRNLFNRDVGDADAETALAMIEAECDLPLRESDAVIVHQHEDPEDFRSRVVARRIPLEEFRNNYTPARTHLDPKLSRER